MRFRGFLGEKDGERWWCKRENAICHATRRVFGGTNKFPLAGATFHGDLGKPGDHCQSARPCFQTAQQEKKFQQAAFNAAHPQTPSANVLGGLSERYYELLWMSCVLPAAAVTLPSDNSRDASRRNVKRFVRSPLIRTLRKMHNC